MSNKDLSKQNRSLEKRDNAGVEQPQLIAPPCDIFENKDEYLVVADIPGVKSADVKLEFHNGELTLHALRTPFGDGVDLFSGERTQYAYARRFRVPAGVQGDAIRADFKEGVLALHIPKEEIKKPRQIPVG